MHMVDVGWDTTLASWQESIGCCRGKIEGETHIEGEEEAKEWPRSKEREAKER